MNNTKYSNQLLYGFFITLASLCMFVIVNLLFYYGAESYDTILFNLLVLVTFFTVFIIWNSSFTESLVDPINLIIYAQFIFLGSNSVLKLLKISSKDFFFGFSLTNNDYNLTNALISLGVIVFLAGAIIGQIQIKKKKSRDVKIIFRENYFKKAGYTILFIGVFSLLIDFDVSWLTTSYRNFGSPTIWRYLWTLCLPTSGFMLMSINNKRVAKTGVVSLLLVSFLYMLMGNRGYAISIFLVLLWLYNNSIKRISKKKFLIISILIVLLSSLFFQMKSYALIEKLSFAMYFSLMEESPIISLFQEGSVTFRTIIYTVKYIPEIKGYQFGMSYLWALTTMIPNIFGTPIHPAHYFYEGPSEWLRWNFSPLQAETGQGFGFSMIGEAFYNFGIIGVVIIMFLFGYCISRLSKQDLANKKVFHKIILSIVLYNSIWGIRNTASSIVRDMTWQILLVIVATLFIKLITKPKQNNS